MVSSPRATTLPWRWSATGSSFRLNDLAYIRQTLSETGWDGFEGHIGNFGQSDQTPESIRFWMEEANLKVATFHLPYGFDDDLASSDENFRQAAVDRLLQAMDLAAGLGTRVCVFHPTVARVDIEVEGFDHFLRPLARSLSILLPRAQQLGLVLALENMCPRPPGTRFGSMPEHFARFRKEFASEPFGFCYDTGHALMALHDRALEILDSMGDLLRAVHLADNAGDRDSHLAPGRGLVDWAGVFRSMIRYGFEGYACVETPPFAYGPVYSLDAWRTHLQNIRRMALRGITEEVQGQRV